MSNFIEWAMNSEYFLSWAIYMLGVVGVLIVAWRMTRPWHAWLKLPLRALLAALLLAPVSVGKEAVFQAPAWVVTPFEWLIGGKETAMPPTYTLMLFGAAALVLLGILILGQTVLKRSSTSDSAS